MRILYSLTALLGLLAAASGYLLWQTDSVNPENGAIFAEASRIKRDFEFKHTPVLALNIESLRLERASKELADPRTALPRMQDYPFAEISRLAHFADTCRDESRGAIHSPDLKKAWEWHRFLCGKSELSAGFFARRPFMHPSGTSYVLLARRSGRKEFSDPEWLSEQEPRLHLLEVLHEEPFKSAGLELQPGELRGLLEGGGIVYGANHVFILSADSRSRSFVTRYSAYLRRDWERFTSQRALVTRAFADPASCVLKDGSVCWALNSGKQTEHTRAAASFLLLGFLVLAGVSGASAFRRINSQKEEAARKLFTLQMLTHELRTPATSLRLSLETLRREFDELPQASQTAFLQMCEELQRLDRIVEASRDYLSSHRPGGFLDKPAGNPVSANSLVESILEPYAGQIAFRPLASDRQVRLERYWLGLCLKNLVDNAFAHGQAPVTVSLAGEQDQLVITVEDAGRAPVASLDEITVPFARSAKSQGLGLGLAVVQKVVRAMNGDLSLKTAPTAFSIRIGDLT